VRILLILLAAAVAPVHAGDGLRRESFDREPAWEGLNHRSPTPEPRQIRQDFGFSRTAHAGGRAGESGGLITPAAEPAYYARRLPPRTFADPLRASGKFAATSGSFHVLIAFFRAETVNEWRTPSSVALRLLGRGDHFYAYLEYATARWRAGGDSPRGFAEASPGGKSEPIRFPLGRPLEWSLEYYPAANGGLGAVSARLGGREALCHLDPGHKADGARFNRFGLLNVVKSADGGGEVWLDDVSVDVGDGPRRDDFSRDPGWEGRGNRREFVTRQVRPRFDFGYSPTRHAGGRRGELGGTVFRGDGRYPSSIAYYADRIGALDLAAPLRASGRVVLRRGVSDSTTLLGFFDPLVSAAVGPGQASGFPDHFLGIAVEGPSAEGFFLYPVLRTRSDGVDGSRVPQPLRILPDGRPHRWSLTYDPAGAGGRGELRATLDDREAAVPLGPAQGRSGIRFTHFGLLTTRVDGNAQEIFFDDLEYSAGPGRPNARQ
jgi:hypothetical protein